MGEKRNGFMQKLNRVVPAWGWAPVVICLVFHLFTFYATRLINAGFTHHEVEVGLDAVIPLWTPAILFYISAYAQWAVCLFTFARAERETCWALFGADLIAKVFCLILFLAYPTFTVRPEITGNGIFDQLTRLIYSMDSPDNLFPSLHVEASWLCFRGMLKLKTVSRRANVFNGVLTVLICLSILFVKQHLFLDLIGGVLVVELGLLLEKPLRISRMYARLEQLVLRRAGV